MIWLLLALICVIAFGIWVYNMDDDFLFKILLWVMAPIFLFLFAYLMIIVSSCFIDKNKTNYIYDKTSNTEIVALNNSTGVSGRSGFLGSGYVSENLYYYYMMDTRKGYKASKIRADDTYVRYSDDPHIETYSVIGFKNKLYYLIAVPFYDCYYIAYIPEGSIIENYKIDLE